MLTFLLGCGSVLIIAFVFTQLIIPALQARSLFPLFRKDIRKAEAELDHTEEDKHIMKMRIAALRIKHSSDEDFFAALDELLDEQDKKRKGDDK